ncbi:hypothetical protein ACJQWK_05453 [Exserohilum turcicum]
MLAIWSRARPTPGTCRCISCSSPAATLSRTGRRCALRAPWALGTPTSTFAYTTVFAAGLAIDAKAKAARNRQWERAFSSLDDSENGQAPVQAGKEPEVAHPAALSFDDLPPDFDWQALQRIVGMDLVDDPVLQALEVESQIRDYGEMNWDDLRFDSRFPGAQLLEWPANTGPDLVRYNLPPQSLWAPDALRLKAMRRRHTWKKMAMQEIATGLLVHELLHRASVARFLKTARHELGKLAPQILEVVRMDQDQRKNAHLKIVEALEHVHKTRVDSSAEEIAAARMHTNHTAIPNYRQDADGDFYSITKQLNEGIGTLLHETPRGNDKVAALAVAKICHNLLISSAPPDLQTFNTLLVGFRRWRRRELVDRVIAAFYANKIRPNEITCREILEHYAWGGQTRASSFSRFVARMRGLDDALMLAHPDININEAGQDRLVRIQPGKIFQKVYPTPMVFSALIGGVMRFAGFDRALDIYYEMKADGWGLDLKGLTRLLGSCVRRADWEGGVYVWGEINSIKSRVKHYDMAKAYTHMLSLCSITENTVAFNQILNDLSKGDFDRKAIIDAATRTASVAKHKQTYTAPAWAADNVMIAVSEYIKDAKSSEPEATSDVVDADDATVSQHEFDVYADIEHNTANTKEVWASWLEHEFGERPKDPEP